ncbi:MAG: SCO family protein [Alphaproteobacteria bacterium]|nr:SCO family protein [Alphaproteobacteria bacterium]
MKQKESSIIPRVITILATSIIILGTYFILIESPTEKIKVGDANKLVHLDIGGDFTLVNNEGIEENTSKYKDKYKLIYFGFTYCPDICPTALSNLSSIIDIAGKYGIDIVPIFVTIDPERDTPEVMKSFSEHFHSKIVGYTGDELSVRKVADLFKVFYAKVPRENGPAEDYPMDHSSFMYFMSPDMKFIKHFPSDASPLEVADFMRRAIRNNP